MVQSGERREPVRNMAFIVVVIAAIIVLALYLKRLNTVPADVRETLGDSVQTMQQIPAAVRQRVQGDYDRAQKRLDEALKER